MEVVTTRRKQGWKRATFDKRLKSTALEEWLYIHKWRSEIAFLEEEERVSVIISHMKLDSVAMHILHNDCVGTI